MKFVESGVEILNISHSDPLKFIESIGRVCYKSENLINEDSSEKFVQMIISRGHESVLEHVSATVKFICDRGVSHEIVRHRIASYSQESTRYCNYAKNKFDNELSFIIPEPFLKNDLLFNLWKLVAKTSEFAYTKLINSNVHPEYARSVLLTSVKTEIVMTANLREWRHFLKLRGSEGAHPDILKLSNDLRNQFKNQIKIIFDE